MTKKGKGKRKGHHKRATVKRQADWPRILAARMLKPITTGLVALALTGCSDGKQCHDWDFNEDGLADRTVCTTSAVDDFRRIDKEYDKDGFLIKKTIYEFGNQYQPSIINEFWPSGYHRKSTIFGQVYHFDKNGKMINQPLTE